LITGGTVTIDLEPEAVYGHALRVVQRAERKLWPLRLKIFVLKKARRQQTPDIVRRAEKIVARSTYHGLM
jgi:hypothetical protein